MMKVGVDGWATGVPAIDIDRIAAASDHAIHDLVGYLSTQRHRPQLMRLLADSPAWLLAKARRLGGDQSTLQDLERAIDSFHDPLDPPDIVALLRLYAVRAVVQQRAAKRQVGGLDTLVDNGRLSEALDAALVLADPPERFSALKTIWTSLKSVPGAAPDKHANILLAARNAADEMPSELLTGQGRADALSWTIDEFLTLGENAAAHATLELMSRTVGDRGNALVRVILGDVRAGHLDAALTLVPGIYNVWQDSEARTALARQLWLARRHADALALAATGRRFVQARVFAAIIEVFTPRDVRTRKKVLDDALTAGREIPAIAETDTERPWDLASAGLRSLANAFASIGRFDHARTAIEGIPYALDAVLAWSDIAAIARRTGDHALAHDLLEVGKGIVAQMHDRDARAKLALVVAAELSTPLDVRFSATDVVQALIDEGRTAAALEMIEASSGDDRERMIERALQATTWSAPEHSRLTTLARERTRIRVAFAENKTAVTKPSEPPKRPSADSFSTGDVRLTLQFTELEAYIATLLASNLPDRVDTLLANVQHVGEHATDPTTRLDAARLLLRFDRVEQASHLLRNGAGDLPERAADDALEAGRLTQALNIARRIADPFKRDAIVERIIESFIAAGRWEEAIAAAREPSVGIRMPMRRVAWSLIRAGEIERGYELATSIDGSEATGAVVALAAAGRMELARQLAEKCLRDDPGDLELFVQALAGEGHYREALSLAERHTDGPIRDYTMLHIVRGAASVNHFDFALTAAQKITDRHDRDFALQGIVAGLKNAGRQSEAEAIAETMEDWGRRNAGLQGLPMMSGGVSMDLWLESGLLGHVRYLARGVSAYIMRVPMLTGLSRAYAGVNDFASAIDVARDIPQGAIQANELVRLANRLATFRRFDEALAVTHDIGPALQRSLELQGLPPREAEVSAKFSLIIGGATGNDALGRTNFPDQTASALATIAIEMRAAGHPNADGPLVEAMAIVSAHELSIPTLCHVARALAALDRWSDGLRTLPNMGAHEFALEVHALRDVLERVRPGLAIEATDAVTGIAGWFDETWRELISP